MSSDFGPVDQPEDADFILASASPRRQQLLSSMRTRFRVVPADIDETPAPNECPSEYVLRMARGKAEAVYRRSADGDSSGRRLPVLGADTAVIAPEQKPAGEHIFGKPESENHAVEMLMALSGKTHRVLSALVMVAGDTTAPMSESRLVKTEVTFRVLSESECHAYWRSGEPEGKAGAYAIQGLGSVFVTHLVGSYSSVVGLPVAETYTLLQTYNIPCGLSGL
ncbi:MAG: Maf family protein [Porticoccaceae bacterium]